MDPYDPHLESQDRAGPFSSSLSSQEEEGSLFYPPSQGISNFGTDGAPPPHFSETEAEVEAEDSSPAVSLSLHPSPEPSNGLGEDEMIPPPANPKIEVHSEDDSDDDSEEDLETDDEMYVQEVRDTSKGLSQLVTHIRQKYPLLQCNQHISDSGIDFIDITRRYLSGSTLPFFQAFHLVILPSIEAGTFFAQMMSYHGKLLEKETLRYNDIQDALDSKLLVKFNTGIFRLCRGLRNINLARLKPTEVLIEYLNELISVRSRQCEFAIFGIWVDNAVNHCSACQRLAASLDNQEVVEFDSADEADDRQEVEENEEEEEEQQEEALEKDSKAEIVIRDDLQDLNDNSSSDDDKPLKRRRGPPRKKQTKVIDVSDLSDLKRRREAHSTTPPVNGKKNLQCLIDLGIIKLEKVTPAEAAKKKAVMATMRGGGGIKTTVTLRGKGRGGPLVPKQEFKPKIVLKTPAQLAQMKGKSAKKMKKFAAQMALMNAKQLPEGIVVNPIRKPARIVNPNAVPSKKVKEDPDQPRVMQTCRVCLFKHDRGYIFDKHIETHEQRYNLNSPVMCPICHTEFATKYELNPHFQEQHNPEQGCCVECQMICDAKALRRHLEYSHYINLKNKLCSHCGQAFRSRQDLEIHIAVAHDKNVQNVICDICGKVLKHPKMLGKHIQSVHVRNNKGRHKCPFCDKVFDKTISWHKHLKVHSRVKPYRCGFCDYRSIKRYNILLHMKKRHKEDATYEDLVKDGDFDYGVPMEDIEMEKYLVPDSPTEDLFKAA